MDKETVMSHLKAKPDLNLFVEDVLADKETLDALFEIVSTEKSSIKYSCTKVIRMVSERNPELLYRYFAVIAQWLEHENSFIKWDGIQILANLVAVDGEDKFSSIYSDYFGLIERPQMITAANVIGNAWKIVLARPEWESDITNRLLNVPKIIYFHKGEPSPECNRIACGHVLTCFEQYFDDSMNQTALLAFAHSQLTNPRKAVAKKADKFLKSHVDKER